MTAEAAGRKIDQVHVLRQVYRPNEPLRAAVSRLVIRAGDSRPFSIYGSDERVVNPNEVDERQYAIQQREAERYMLAKRATHLDIEAGIKARLVRLTGSGAAALQLVMTPADKQEYRKVMLGLDVVRFGERRAALGFKALQLYMSIPFGQLLPLPDVKDRLGELNELLDDTTSHLKYQVTPLPYLVNTIGQPRKQSPKN